MLRRGSAFLFVLTLFARCVLVICTNENDTEKYETITMPVSLQTWLFSRLSTAMSTDETIKEFTTSATSSQSVSSTTKSSDLQEELTTDNNDETTEASTASSGDSPPTGPSSVLENTTLLADEETAYSYMTSSATTEPYTTATEPIVTANSSTCPVVIVTPGYISQYFGSSALFTGIVETYSDPALSARWIKMDMYGRTQIVDINTEKYSGSKSLPYPALVINEVDFDDEVSYQLQVEISGGWCLGNYVSLDVRGILNFSEPCNMTKECNQEYWLQCSPKYNTCMCDSGRYHRNETCFPRYNLRVMYREWEITTSRITVWWGHPSVDSDLVQSYSVRLTNNGRNTNLNGFAGRDTNYTFDSNFTLSYLYYCEITSTVVLKNPTDMINVTTTIPLVIEPLPPGPIDKNASHFHPERLYLRWSEPENNTYVYEYRVTIRGTSYYDWFYASSNIRTWPTRLEPGTNYSVTIVATARGWGDYYFAKHSTAYTERIETLRTPIVKISEPSTIWVAVNSVLEIMASVKNVTNFPQSTEAKWQRMRWNWRTAIDIDITNSRYNISTLDPYNPTLVINKVDYSNDDYYYYQCAALNTEGWGTSNRVLVRVHGDRTFMENCSRDSDCNERKHLTCHLQKCLCYSSYFHEKEICYQRTSLRSRVMITGKSKCGASVEWWMPSSNDHLITNFTVVLYSMHNNGWRYEETVNVGNHTNYTTRECKFQPGRLHYFGIRSNVKLSNPSETFYVESSSSWFILELYPPGNINQNQSKLIANKLYLKWEESGHNTFLNHYKVTINGHEQLTYGSYPEVHWERPFSPGSKHNVTIVAVSYGDISSGPWYIFMESEPSLYWIEFNKSDTHKYTFLDYGEGDSVLGNRSHSAVLSSPIKVPAGDGAVEGFRDIIIGSNGIIGLGNDSRKITGGTIHYIDTSEDKRIICPFYTSVSSQHTAGNVYYKAYSRRSRTDVDDLFLEEANELIRLNFGDFPDYNATWLVKATWENMTLSGDIPLMVTFQCLLITDGRNTFTVFNYIDVNLTSIPGKNITIGYQYNRSSVIVPFSNTQQAFQMSNHPGNRGVPGFWIYKMTTGIPRNSDEKLCYDWYQNSIDKGVLYNLLAIRNQIECPCDSRLLRFDPRYAMNRFDRKNRVLCYASMTTGINAECCYRMHGSINNLSTLEQFLPSAGTFLEYNPFFERKLYIKNDLKQKEACCTSGHCQWYYEIRPIPRCYTRSPFQNGVNFGDPHILTLDGKNYTFNGLGEYTMLKIDTENTTFDLQARTELATTANGSTINATVFSAFVAQDQTGSKVQIEMTRDKKKMIIRVNENDMTREFEDAEYYYLTQNLSLRWENQSISASFLKSSILLKFSLGVRFLISETVVDNKYKGLLKGLMGNFDGIINNDFILPNGTTLDDNATTTERDIYYNFGQLWLVNENSTFHYSKGLTFKNYTHPEFEPIFLDEIDEQKLEDANRKCGKNPSQACVFDYLATGDITLAESSGTEETVSLSDAKLIDNESPSISGNTSINAEVGKVVELWFNATDDGSQAPKYNSLKHPSNFTLNTTSGLATWTPQDTNTSEISISVVDEMNAESPSIDVTIVLCGGCENQGRCDFVNTLLTDNVRFNHAKCICKIGFSGDRCELDTDGCLYGPCSLGRECTDLTPEEEQRLGRGYNCSECPAGFKDINNECEDINECGKDNSDVCSPTTETCENTEGSFLCNCIKGYRKENNTCRDIDECLERTSGCEQTCQNTPGSFLCGCFSGFALNTDNSTCIHTDEDPCKDLDINCEFTCNSTTGKCICPIGFRLHDDGHSCIDIDECEKHLSPCHQECNNRNGSFQCYCRPGYSLNDDKISCTECAAPNYGENCSQICRCGEGMDKCDPVSGCVCQSGWTGKFCSDDIDECETDQDICGSDKVCKNLQGSFLCTCKEGFYDDNNHCQDIDECSDLSLNDCPENTICKNLHGNYSCFCRKGYQRNNSICEDVDECTQNIHGCSQICINTNGGYNCECEFGFALHNDRRNCEKVSDVCDLFPELNCSYGCLTDHDSSNKVQGYCFCESGYELNLDNRTCKDIDECSLAHTCEQNCTNKDGSFECACRIGYTLQNDGKTCEVCIEGLFGENCLQECQCGRGSERCDHISGCVCASGWTGESCDQDINECNDTDQLCQGEHEVCMNTVGSYRCDCEEGFHNSTNGCLECLSGYYGKDCQMQCLCNHNNTESCDKVTGFCVCKEGWNGPQCIEDVNECTNASICPEHSECRNFDGSYSCNCNEGFTLVGGYCSECNDGFHGKNCQEQCLCNPNNTESCDKVTGTCVCRSGWSGPRCNDDIDECQNKSVCSNHSECINLDGSYSCNCMEGFTLNDGQCVECKHGYFGMNCMSQCSCNPNTIEVCVKENGECICREGWGGLNCDEDINECSNTSICPEHAECTNSNGSFKCECMDGFSLREGLCIECENGSYGRNCQMQCLCNLNNSASCDKVTGSCNCTQGWSGSQCNDDINECSNTSICPKHSICVNSDGSYTCVCKDGFTLAEMMCVECKDGFHGKNCQEQCLCNPNNTESCDKVTGACVCRSGWSGPRCNDDIDECVNKSICSNYSECINLNGSYSCNCIEGFTLVGENCVECKHGYFGMNCMSQCSCNPNTTEVCVKENGECICRGGWGGLNCDEDINECSNTSICPEHAACTNSIGSFKCECMDGFSLREGLCIECENGSYGRNCQMQCLCNLNNTASCDKVTGSCNCTQGWNGSQCNDDINECSNTSICPENAICVNSDGSYTCVCKDGFTLAEMMCVECMDGFHGKNCKEQCSCNPNNTESCDKVTGACVCRSGWTGSRCNGDIDECLNESVCSNHSECINLNGSYSCNCMDGFTLNDGHCVECVNGLYGKDCQMQCLCNQNNTRSCDKSTGFCVCKEGWNGSQCIEDVNECSNASICPVHSECKNFDGSYSCNCNEGFTLVGGYCSDCKHGYFGLNCTSQCSCNSNTTELCVKETGVCICREGWGGLNCDEDINECSNTSICPEHAECSNSNGSYKCECMDGFTLLGGLCIECENGSYGRNCQMQCLCNLNNTASCDKVTGSCNCKQGWNGSKCNDDINECSNTSICPKHSICVNSDGSYTCVCKDGFTLAEMMCVECKDGFHGKNCQEQCLCNPNNTESCDKVTGSCVCRSGWNGAHCGNDIDECVNTTICQNHSECINLNGSYSCNCMEGFKLVDGHCVGCNSIMFGDQCLETCKCNMDGTADCNNVNGNCTCKEYWNGTTCEFLDECKAGIDICHMNSTCEDTADSYNCICNAGFSGDGINCSACNANRYGTQCSESCKCVMENTRDCDDVTGMCICHDKWNGTHCDVPVDDCRNGTSVCDPDLQDCVRKSEENKYFCSCRYGTNGTTGGICLSPVQPYTTTAKEIKFRAQTTLAVEITQEEFQEKTKAIVDDVFNIFTGHFRSRIPGFNELIILSIRLGSLNIKYEIIARKNEIPHNQAGQYVWATKQLLGKSVVLESLDRNSTVSLVKIVNEQGNELVLDNADNQCDFLQHISPCSDGEICVETSGPASCLTKEVQDYVDLIIGLGIGIPFLLIAITAMFVIFVYCKRKYEKRDGPEIDRSYEGSDAFESRIPVGRDGKVPFSLKFPWSSESDIRRQSNITIQSSNTTPTWHQKGTTGIRNDDGHKGCYLDQSNSDSFWDFTRSYLPTEKSFEIRRPVAERRPNPLFRDSFTSRHRE